LQPGWPPCDPGVMLVELAIRDLALIERASLSFDGGLNVITGETGAGKSLLIGALELLLGQRGRSALVRKGARQARVEGRFLLATDGYGEGVNRWLEEHLPETLEDWREEGDPEGELELILTRTLGRDGRSKAHVNHRPVTQRVLRELAAQLIEIHGQNDHQRLFEPAEQLRLLDGYGELEDQLAGYRERRSRWLELAERLEHYDESEAVRLQRLDLLRFQVAELAEIAPEADERARLEADREVLRHADSLNTEVGEWLTNLSDREDAALDLLRRTERSLEGWRDRVESLADPAASLRESVAHLEEAVTGLVSFASGLEGDPRRLEEVEVRLAELERLERKHGTDTVGLVRVHEQLEAELTELESEAQGREELAADTHRALSATNEAGRRLDRERRALAPRLEEAAERALAELGLERASFAIDLSAAAEPEEGAGLDAERRHLGSSGIGSCEFLLAANPGESREPLRRVASGGEAARILLALRVALAVRRSTPTLVFDEVDAGVGGRLGPKVGRHLTSLAELHQVLCVSHLPAIAAAADHHLLVSKAVSGGRTRTDVALLSDEDRVEEIADMIAGGGAHETARAEARRLLEEAR